MTQPIWSPTPEQIEASNLYAFREKVRAVHDIPGNHFAHLHRWSVSHMEAFWEAAWYDARVSTQAGHTAVLADSAMPPKRSSGVEVWFPGARFNFAQHLLRYRDDRIALVAENEDGKRRTITFRELYQVTVRCQSALKDVGVGPGDRVAGYLPNTLETVIAMLAVTSLGAIWSSTSPDFGYQGALDRFGQIEPKVLLSADGYFYNGKYHETVQKSKQLVEAIRSIEAWVMIPFTDRADRLPRDARSWESFLAPRSGDMEFPSLSFEQPVYILYSSGTTGAPKCIVHGAGGTLLKHHVEHRLHTDLRRDDVFFYFTTCGWMMWNWLVSGLAQGCTVVLYDGSPSFPDPERLFRLADDVGISVFGTSPRFLTMCEKAGLTPRLSHHLTKLRTILSTGAPLEPSQFEYTYQAVKPDVQLSSISGGTDLIGCFMLGNPLSPVYAGEIQGPALGMDIAALDAAGRPVSGGKGELVCRNAFPSMPIGFWQDPDGLRYRAAYFETYPGVWRHGDFITLTEHGGVVVHGRSDATLNPGGVRIGTAEVYRIVETLPFVADSLVLGHKTGDGEQIILFVVLRDGLSLTEARETEIRSIIREKSTPRHIPSLILQIDEVPVTINGKKVELAVTGMLRGEVIENREALANPEALRQFEGLIHWPFTQQQIFRPRGKP